MGARTKVVLFCFVFLIGSGCHGSIEKSYCVFATKPQTEVDKI